METALWSNALSYTPARVSASIHLVTLLRNSRNIPRLYAPKCTQTERSLLASDPVIRFVDIVAVNKVLSAICQPGGKTMNPEIIYVGSQTTSVRWLEDMPQRGHKAWVRLMVVNTVFYLLRQSMHTHRLDEEYQGHYEDRWIENVGLFITLAKTLQLRIPRLQHDLLIEFIASCNPFISLGTRKRSFIRKSKTFSEAVGKR